MMRVATVLLLAGAASAQSYCSNSYTGCRPAGERMYTAYPNSPVMGKEFSLLIVGCNIDTTGGGSVNRDYVIVPGDRPCESVDVDTLPGDCKMNSDTLELTKRIPAVCKTTGWLCTNCAKLAHKDDDRMSTTAITKIIYDEGSATPDAGGELVPLRLCRQSIGYDAAGNQTRVWSTLPAHDRAVSSRSDTMSLSVEMVVRGAAGIPPVDYSLQPEGTCCEGLKLGDACLPLIVFILLWLLMTALLALLAWMCHKNQTDVDAERNNQQFSNFGTDRELQDLAEGKDQDDDDI